MSTKSDEIRFLIEELAKRVPYPDPITAESLFVTRLTDGNLVVQSFSLNEGCTVALLNGKLVSVPYNGLEISREIAPGEEEVVYNQFNLGSSSKLIVDMKTTEDSGVFELLARPLKSGEIDFVRFGQLGIFPQYELSIKIIGGTNVLVVKNLDTLPIQVSIKVAK